MTPKMGIGASGLTLHQGYTVVVSESDGRIAAATEKGIYFFDTRLVSAWNICANGTPWILLNSGVLSPAAGRIHCVNAEISANGATIPEKTLALVIGRHIDAGLHEDLDITNYGDETARFTLTVTIESDFADLFDVKNKKPVTRGSIEQSIAADSLTVCYRNKDFHRGLRVRIRSSGGKIEVGDGALSFRLEIAPNAIWHACLLYDFADGEAWFQAPQECVCNYEASEAVTRLKRWMTSVVKVTSSNAAFDRTFDQALQDMMALRLPIAGTDHIKFVPAAGLPWFVALFGRDSLIVSLQAAVVHPEFALGSLIVLGRWQAAERDDYRDAEPGKILHELRRGELAHFRLIPHTPYYGTADATPLYLIALHSAWMCTGDVEMLRKHLATAEGCLTWIDRYGDRDGDGFQEYRTRSPAGYENQGWKDSKEAVVDVDGSLVKGPKALCELQGYVYDAWLRMAQIFDALQRCDRAAELREKARRLFDRFNARFWNEAEGFYAYALDGDKKPIWSVASNPGQCLWSGIVPAERAERVANRLMQPDMFGAWGIRTLSARHPSFNPLQYQIGSVWPQDNGLIAQGMKRYEQTSQALRIAAAILNAARFFKRNQLPELYADLRPCGQSLPAEYLGANVPQGWAAGSVFSLLQVLLGFQPDAPQDRLYIDPTLPEWLSGLTVRNIRVGRRTFDIRLVRNGGNTEWEVAKGERNLVKRRPMREWHELFTAKGGAPANRPRDKARGNNLI